MLFISFFVLLVCQKFYQTDKYRPGPMNINSVLVDTFVLLIHMSNCNKHMLRCVLVPNWVPLINLNFFYLLPVTIVFVCMCICVYLYIPSTHNEQKHRNKIIKTFQGQCQVIGPVYRSIDLSMVAGYGKWLGCILFCFFVF